MKKKKVILTTNEPNVWNNPHVVAPNVWIVQSVVALNVCMYTFNNKLDWIIIQSNLLLNVWNNPI